MADLACVADAKERNHITKHLKCMAVSLQEMGVVFQPAERMCLVLQHVLAEIYQRSPQKEASIVPASRQSVDDDTNQNAPKRQQRLDPRPTPTPRKSEGVDSIQQLRSGMNSISSPLPDILSDGRNNDVTAHFTPQSDIGGWPFPSPDSQVGGSSLPTSAPTMYGSMPQNSWVPATSHMPPDAASMSFSPFTGFPHGSTPTGHMDFLPPSDEPWVWQLDHHGQIPPDELKGLPPGKRYR